MAPRGQKALLARRASRAPPDNRVKPVRLVHKELLDRPGRKVCLEKLVRQGLGVKLATVGQLGHKGTKVPVANRCLQMM